VDERDEVLVEESLHKAMDVVSDGAALVELWACALSSFAQPMLPYDPDGKYRLDHVRS
jgi:hypothetical protein